MPRYGERPWTYRQMAEADSTDRPDPDRERLRDCLFGTARGDRECFEDLYLRTSPKLFGICLRILHERNEAEEVLQDVYLSIWGKASQYDDQRASPITWLAMIARNKAIDRLRASRLDRASLPIDLAGELIDRGLDAQAMAEAASEGQRLHDCLDELTGEQGRVIRVAFFEGCTYEDIAQRSATPIGTIKSWIRRGLLKLKDCLQR